MVCNPKTVKSFCHLREIVKTDKETNKFQLSTNLFKTESVFGCDISTFFIRNKMKIVKQKPVTEEVKKWSIEFMRSVETEGYESMVSKLNELTPELKDGVLEYLQRINDYCMKHSMNDHLEGVNTYKDLINIDNNFRKTNCNKFYRKMLGKGKVYKGFKVNVKGFSSSRRERRKIERELLRQKKVG